MYGDYGDSEANISSDCFDQSEPQSPRRDIGKKKYTTSHKVLNLSHILLCRFQEILIPSHKKNTFTQIIYIIEALKGKYHNRQRYNELL